MSNYMLITCCPLGAICRQVKVESRGAVLMVIYMAFNGDPTQCIMETYTTAINGDPTRRKNYMSNYMAIIYLVR